MSQIKVLKRERKRTLYFDMDTKTNTMEESRLDRNIPHGIIEWI